MKKKLLILLITILIVVGVFWVVSRYTAIPQAAQSLYKSANDLSLSSKVKSSFLLSKRLSPYELKPQANNGIVTLTGVVPSEIDKELAAQVTTDTVGVTGVNNQIEVSPDTKPTEESLRENARIIDLEIKADLSEKLAQSEELKYFKLATDVNKRVVSLSGEVDTRTQKLGAEQVARSVGNVKDVTNNLTMRYPEASRDEVPGLTTNSSQDQQLLKQAQFILFNERENFIDASNINIKVNEGIVTLTGNVHSPAESRLATLLIRGTDGVKEVRNQLTITL